MNDITQQQINYFWSKVDIKSENECWNWLGCKIKGYGTIKLNQKPIRTHRLSYFLTYGEITTGLLICHKCNNPSCCNPNHLYAGTNKENTQDIINSGNFKMVGESHWNSKLTFVQVSEIRELLSQGVKEKEVAKIYSMSKRQINDIKNRKSWNY